ncbi:hypothetical protein ABPG75_012905 [Micractinium tetrahymenae]
MSALSVWRAGAGPRQTLLAASSPSALLRGERAAAWSPRSRQQTRQLGRCLAGRRRQRGAARTPRASWAQSNAVGHHRAQEVIGVVIVDAGRRTPEGDELLLDFATAYGQAYRRDIVSVANPATLEIAVRDCVEEGANKVMVVPYLLSRRREVEGDLPRAVADVQLKLPGVRCIIGESISVESILAQHVENQVKAVEATAVDVAERWWSPQVEQEWQQERAVEQGRAGSAALPAAQQESRSWGDAFVESQPAWDAVVETVEEEAEEEALLESRAAAAPPPAAAAAVPQPAAPAGPTVVAWSDDFSAVLQGGVLVADYRAPQPAATAAAPAATASASEASGLGWGGDSMGSSRQFDGGSSSGGASEGRDGPAYWYTDTDTSSAADGGSARGGSSGSSSTWGTSAAATNGWGVASSASTSGGSAWGSTAGISFWDANPTMPEGAAEEEAAEAEAEGAPLQSRLASMEAQLKRITNLLERQWAPRRGGQAGAADAGSVDPAHYSEEQLSFLQRKGQNTASTAAPSTKLGRHRSNDVLGVVIVDEGRRTPESDEILLDVAACYGQAYRRDCISVASPATLEVAVRGCVADGANKVMVVPYLLSRSRSGGSTNLPLALADVQLKLPGIRCITGESISVESILAQHIENQVKVVDTKPVDVAERWWSPEPLAAASQRAQQGRKEAQEQPAAGLLPAEQQHGWGDAVDGAARGQPQPTPAGPQPAHAVPPAAQRAEQPRAQAGVAAAAQQVEQPSTQASSSVQRSHAINSAGSIAPTAAAVPAAPAATATAASTAARSTEQPGSTAVVASAHRPQAVWSDDLGSLLLNGSGAGVVVVRDCRSKQEPAAAAAAACAAVASAAPEAQAPQPSSSAAQSSTSAASAPSLSAPEPAHPDLAALASATAPHSPEAAAAAAATAPPAAAEAAPASGAAAPASPLAKLAEVATRMAAARVVPLFFLSFWLAAAVWGALFLSWAHLSSSLMLHSLSLPLLMGMLLLLSGGLAATVYVGDQARRRGQAIA